MSDEDSKTTQEVAKAARELIVAGEKIAAFVNRILGGGFSHLGNAFSDWAQGFRYTNLLRLIDKIDVIHAKRRVEGKKIPLAARYVIPILEYASLEEEDTLQDLWAGLLANATDPNHQFQLHKLHIELLSNLDPIDVKLMGILGDPDTYERFQLIHPQTLNAEKLSEYTELDREDVLISLANLFRNGLIIDSWEHTLAHMDTGYSGFRVNNPSSNFRLSHLGRNLLQGCDAKE